MAAFSMLDAEPSEMQPFLTVRTLLVEVYETLLLDVNTPFSFRLRGRCPCIYGKPQPEQVHSERGLKVRGRFRMLGAWYFVQGYLLPRRM